MDFQLNCPLPLHPDTIQLAHGGGGKVMRDFLENRVLPAFGNEALNLRHDCALVTSPGTSLAFATDTYVVCPSVFPGGDIGKLAVFGTVNDLAMGGAVPLFLSAGFILEEGYPLEELDRVLASMAAAAKACGISIVTGDTKVVDRGKGDGIYINTSGIGIVPPGRAASPRQVQPGDAVLLSGDVGCHGIAVLSAREGLPFQTPVESDCASLLPLTEALHRSGASIHCMRDPTRGGLASVLNEIALDAGVGMVVEESAIPLAESVATACELLGLDPLYIACEGRMVAFVPEAEAPLALEALRSLPQGSQAVRIGTVLPQESGRVLLRTRYGAERILDLLSGEQLPRIC